MRRTGEAGNIQSLSSHMYCYIYTVILFICLFLGWIAAHFFFRACKSAGTSLHEAAASALVRAKISFFEQNPSGT